MESLFEAFVQTEAGRKSQEGTGLGLPISQKFVQLMGGDIKVSSIVGQGTTFEFHICIKLAEAVQVRAEQSQRQVISLAPDQPTYRILVVDDKWESRLILVNLMAPLGFEVQEAENGEEAVKICQRWQPDLIWMDMRMPVMSGYQATRRIREQENGQEAVIIALTASVFDKQRSVVLSAGCNDFVSKPFRQEVIFDKMAQYLGVRYVYQQESPTATTVPDVGPISIKEIQTQVTLMPAEWLLQLHWAALELDEEQMLDLIEILKKDQPAIAKTLEDLVNDFQFEKIANLTKPTGE
ncbi:MAG: response regulator [Coleofasciculaceae cyanobacterium]